MQAAQIKNLVESLDLFDFAPSASTPEEDGMFTDRGYVAYKGFFRMEEVMNGSQSSRMEMGGML